MGYKVSLETLKKSFCWAGEWRRAAWISSLKCNLIRSQCYFPVSVQILRLSPQVTLDLPEMALQIQFHIVTLTISVCCSPTTWDYACLLPHRIQHKQLFHEQKRK